MKSHCSFVLSDTNFMFPLCSLLCFAGNMAFIYEKEEPRTISLDDESVQFSSVIQSCPTLCHPMNRRMPGLPVHHQHLESTQTHVHWVCDAIQPSHPLSSPAPPALNLSQHQGFFSNESAFRIKWPNYWSFSFSISPTNEHPRLISFRMDWLDLLAVQGLSRVFSNTTVQKIQFFGAPLSLQSNSHIRPDHWNNHSLDYMDFCWQSNVSAF